MTCLVIRHGKDDESLRGGWGMQPLSPEGRAQAEELARRLKSSGINARWIFTSDLKRARETAEILGEALSLPVVDAPQFREVNNGLLAGMENAEAERLYPGLYWSALDWEQSYPQGESPREFFERVEKAWYQLKLYLITRGQSAILVTHGGVINAIACIEMGVPYSNRRNPCPVAPAGSISFEI